MNILISFFTVFHCLGITQKRIPLTFKSRGLLLLGTLLPAGDYLLRLIQGEMHFQNGNWYFHSFLYQAVFWTVSVLLYWVHSRNLRKACRFFLPLVGLFCTLLFSLMGSEGIPFFTPISYNRLQLDLFNIGFLLPVLVCIGLLLLQLLLKFPPAITNWCAIGYILFFLASSLVIRSTLDKALTRPFREAKQVSMYPANFSQTRWYVVAVDREKYLIGQYHLFQGWLGKASTLDQFSDLNLSQQVLQDPFIRNLYLHSFRLPRVEVSIQNNLFQIVLSEPLAFTDLFGIKKIKITKKRSGQILDFVVHYQLFGLEFSSQGLDLHEFQIFQSVIRFYREF